MNWMEFNLETLQLIRGTLVNNNIQLSLTWVIQMFIIQFLWLIVSFQNVYDKNRGTVATSNAADDLLWTINCTMC